MTDNRSIIFFDTNFIEGVSFGNASTGNKEWKNLLEQSENDEIRIITHRIIINEWKIRSNFKFKKTYKDSAIKSKIEGINNSWKEAIKSYNLLNENNEYKEIITYKDLYSEIQNTLNNLDLRNN